MLAAKARSCWGPPPEAEGRRLGIQASGGGHSLHIQYLKGGEKALSYQYLLVLSEFALAFFAEEIPLTNQ